MRLNNYAVPKTDLTVSPSFMIDSKSLGGNSSSTDAAHRGIKPKMLRVTLTIPYSDSAVLNALVRVSEAVDSNGDMVVYTVTDRSANAFGVKQVTFDGNFSATKDKALDVWRVQFLLKEKKSTPEKVEQRLDVSATSVQTSVNSAVSVVADNEVPETLTGVERFLSSVEKALS